MEFMDERNGERTWKRDWKSKEYFKENIYPRTKGDEKMLENDILENKMLRKWSYVNATL